MVAHSQLRGDSARPAPALRLRELQRPALPLYTATILAVTADPHALRLVGSLLQQAELEHRARFVESARQTEEFLQRCASDPTAVPRVLVLDLYLPHSEGLRLLRWARRQRALRTMAVVALGFQNSEQDAAQAFAAGAQAYLPKFSPESEIAHLGRLLRSVVLTRPLAG